MIKENKIYIAGPMTCIPKFNFPAFDAAAAKLRKEGYEVWSPAEMDDPETRELALASPDGMPGTASAKGETWGDFLARDVKIVADTVEAIAVLPGWNKSKGARLETFIAFLCYKPIYYYSSRTKVPFTILIKAWTNGISNASNWPTKNLFSGVAKSKV